MVNIEVIFIDAKKIYSTKSRTKFCEIIINERMVRKTQFHTNTYIYVIPSSKLLFSKNNYIFIKHFLNFVKAQGDKTKSSYQNYHYFLISIKFSNKNNFSNKASHIGNPTLSHTKHRKYFGYVLIKDKILFYCDNELKK